MPGMKFRWSLLILLGIAGASPITDQPASAPSAASAPSTPSSFGQRHDPPPPQKQRPRPPRTETDQWLVPSKDLVRGRFVTFRSSINDSLISYVVYTPPDYEEKRDQRYPTIYWLPSYSGDCREAGPMMEKFDQAIKLKVCPPVIVVGVQGVFCSMYTDARDHGRPVEAIIMKELIARVDA